MVRGIPFCLLVGALLGCAPQRTIPARFAAAEDAVRAVCVTPTSHREIVQTVRALNWPLLTRDQVPEQIVGNGMVTWSAVALAPHGDTVIAAGRLGGTSFCRVYRRQRPHAPLASRFEFISLFGSPLGKPDFRKHIEGSDVTGWLKGGDEWRAVHVSEALLGSVAPDRMPVMIEVTRAAT